MKIYIASATKGKREDTQLFKSYKRGIEASEYFTYISVRENNKRGLPAVYNSVLKDPDIHKDYNCVIFVHDDVRIEDASLGAKLKQAFKYYDVVGLAGMREYEVKEPGLWHLGSKSGIAFHGASGAVAHQSDSGAVTMSSFGPAPKEVDVIDGLFIAVNLQKIKDTGVLFDENFNFHHYDLTFCHRAKKAGLKVGVWPIWCVHMSPGLLNANDTEFTESKNKYIALYGKTI